MLFQNNSIGGSAMGIFQSGSDTPLIQTVSLNNYCGVGTKGNARITLYKENGGFYVSFRRSKDLRT